MRFLLVAGVFTCALLGFFSLSSSSPSRAESEQTVQANDNRLAAGRLTGSVLHVSLDARIAIWHPDGNDGPGIPIQTFGEAGKTPQIPGPLIRVPAGTTVIASVQNLIPAITLTMHGMVDRPAVRDRPTRVPFGKTSVIRFRPGSPGTYLYWGATAGETIGRHFGPDSRTNRGIYRRSDGRKRCPERSRLRGWSVDKRPAKKRISQLQLRVGRHKRTYVATYRASFLCTRLDGSLALGKRERQRPPAAFTRFLFYRYIARRRHYR